MDDEGTNATTETAQIDLERRRLAIDEAKLKIEQDRSASDGRFFTRHTSEVIAGAIALASVAVSVISVSTAYLQKGRELDQQTSAQTTASLQKDKELAQQQSAMRTASLQKERELEVAERDFNYKRKLDMMQYIDSHSKELFSGDWNQIFRVHEVMLVVFPADDVREWFRGLQAQSTPKIPEKAWRSADKTAVSIVIARSSYAYLGQWQNGLWLTHYLETTDGKPLVSPDHLKGMRLRVGAKAVNLRSDLPDASGNNGPSKGGLHSRDEVIVVDAPLYNTGVNDSGFIWARLEAAK